MSMVCDSLHSALAPLLKRYDREQIGVVYDVRVGLERIGSEVDGLPSLGLEISEADKSLAAVTRIWDFLFEHHITRRGLLVCIGGGVLTDVAGFAAATYKRGMDYINIPTTLLAMIDASSGGKTGFNYHGLKNSIGAFWPPVETIIDTEWLKTLPAKEFLSGFGEMLKTGLINDGTLWNRLLQYDLDAMPLDTITPLIETCVCAKEKIVAADPKEDGLRKVLNFGHTFGHALEEISLGTMPHGYAVVYGLIAELYLSVVKLGCPREPLQQLTQVVLHYYGKPQCKCSDRKQLIELIQQDKKNEHADEINCTLIQSVGQPLVNQVITPAEEEEALDYLFSL